MPSEIERKFLVKSDRWRDGATAHRITQGYLCRDPDRTVRVRIKDVQAFMTIKGRASGITRTEIEFPVPMEHAQDLIALCLPAVIDKTRHVVHYEGMLWEVDEFHGENEGLVMAEIELPSEDTSFSLPEWAGPEVSDDWKYTNARLSEHPFKRWSTAERGPTA